MSEHRDQGFSRHDILGVVVMGIAGFLGVTTFMSLLRPLGGPAQGLDSAAMRFVGLLGPYPGLVLCAGLVVFGGHLFLNGPRGSTLRNLLGICGGAVGLGILMGALRPEAGGAVGGLTGEALARSTWPFLGPFLGVLLGLVCLFASFWYAWLRYHPSFLRKTEPAGPLGADPSLGEIEGVSAAEAAALLPSEPEPRVGGMRARKKPAKEKKEREESDPTPAQAEAEPELSPLYPPDVRLEGRIPDGARPLTDPDDPTRYASDAADAAVPGWASDEAHPVGESPGGHLAAPQPEIDPEARSAVASPQDEGPQADPASTAAASGSEAVAEPPVTEAGAHGTVPPAAAVAPLADPSVRPAPDPGQVPSPRWEQEELFVSGEAAAEASTEPPAEPEADDHEEVVYEEEGEGPEEEYEEEEPEGEYEEEYAEEEEEYEEEPEEEEGPEEEPEEEEGPEEEYEEEDAEEEDAEEEDAEEEDAEEEDAEEEDAEEEYEEEEYEEEPEDEVVIQPAAAAEPAPPPPEPEPPAEPAAAGAVEEDLIERAGTLILERGRVAVSLLQREFDLDFKQATLVLDQLQEAGLIGPYLGGQRRDILMTLEEWQQKVGAS